MATQLERKLNAMIKEKRTKLLPEIIKKGEKVFGVTGTLELDLDTSDATATPSDILSGETAYVNTYKITGTIPNNGTKTYKPSDEVINIDDGYHYNSTVLATDITDLNEYKECLDLSNILLYDKAKPNRLDYIQSTGTQWIDTGFYPNENTAVEMDVSNATQGDYWLFTAWNQWESGYFVTTQNNGYSWYFPTNQPTFVKNLEDRARLKFYNKYIYHNDEVVVTGADTLRTEKINNNIHLFGGSFNSGHTGRFKLYGCKIWDNGTLVRDFIPVEDFNGVACLYDKVTEEFYYNAGTGEFTAGPAYIELEYIQGTGTQYIDTGVKVNSGYKTILDLQLNNNATNYICGVMTTSIVRNYLCNYNNGTLLGINSDISSSQNLINGTRYKVEACTKSGEGYLKINDTTTVTTTNTYNDITDLNIYLFTANYNNGPIKNYSSGLTNMNGNLYSCKIYDDNDELVRDFIPVKDENDVVCLYDKVTEEFYYSQGTGDFIGGDEV